MTDLTPDGQRIVEEAARRHGISTDAVRVVLEALVASGGGMAQFNHPDLGGMGQWSRGGMIMIGDMFNSGLKSRIAALCDALSDVVERAGQAPSSSQRQSQGNDSDRSLPPSSFFVRDERAGDWWPSDLGFPASTGAQNSMRYAYFPDRRRLVLDLNGQVSVYDTGDHAISGFSQQQGGDQSVRFSSQHGSVGLTRLRPVSGPGAASGSVRTTPASEPERTTPAPAPGPERMTAPSSDPRPTIGSSQAGSDIFDSIERLAGLRDKGFISDDEFTAKKTELLKRL